ncbi:thioredoxin domain-containing protein [Chthonomonas calidirosea]|uniref:thioredoxin domain-containing protein n=1 Tax=Chthonomonas calidirosea TaxID=454171 RepID=UPI0006EC5906|nr:thioredoxin domain-containing protein [Chthonomonas calidirosea]CEK16041.1 highly conserved protein containing a thioredoxin domain [Chthonomonas calidirosea]
MSENRAPTNRLIHETSPYLLQHAHNPVDWYPWGEEALRRAKEEQKPILLSIGYSACHWCHVMERECFENPEIAAQMNRDFVNIKVDREERPDLDAIYMNAVVAMTGQGGWPLTVFLTPDGVPFFGGTYFPPEDRYGRPGFPRVLTAVAEAWRTRHAEIEAQSRLMLQELSRSLVPEEGVPMPLTPDLLEKAYRAFAESFDAAYGGFGGAPKFPQASGLEFLMRYYLLTKRVGALEMVEKTLQQMALGGLRDQLGGGFHRYSVDARWLVPHFEKMLYDNAQLIRVYLHAAQITGNALYRDVVADTCNYALREMRSPEGGFYSAQDADSEGEEGKYYVWRLEEVKAVLEENEAKLFCAFYDVTEAGNWEGRSILHVAMPLQQLAERFGITLEQAAERLASARAKLLAYRMQRVPPATDDKVLTAWNGLMLSALAESGAVLEERRFLEAAEGCGRFIEQHLTYRDAEGRLRLYHLFAKGHAKGFGLLEDYAFCIEGFLCLYEATLQEHWLALARELAKSALSQFEDTESGGFFTTPPEQNDLIYRPMDWTDDALPSGNSVMSEVLQKLALLTGEAELREAALRTLRRMVPLIERYPTSFSRALCALCFYLSDPQEVALLGSKEALEDFLRVLRETYRPNLVLAQADTAEAANASGLALLEGKTLMKGRPTAYVCKNYACKAPTTEPMLLRQQLSSRQ